MVQNGKGDIMGLGQLTPSKNSSLILLGPQLNIPPLDRIQRVGVRRLIQLHPLGVIEQRLWWCEGETADMTNAAYQVAPAARDAGAQSAVRSS